MVASELAERASGSGAFLRSRITIGYCITWTGKVFHEHGIAFWLGRQPFGPQARLRRDRPNEYYGCAAWRRYRDYCRAADLGTSGYHHWIEQYGATRRFLSELGRREAILVRRNSERASGAIVPTFECASAASWQRVQAPDVRFSPLKPLVEGDSISADPYVSLSSRRADGCDVLA